MGSFHKDFLWLLSKKTNDSFYLVFLLMTFQLNLLYKFGFTLTNKFYFSFDVNTFAVHCMKFLFENHGRKTKLL